MIHRFDEIHPGQLALVGGKGLNLGRLSRAGLPVPPGFVLTTAFVLDAAGEAALLAAYRELGGGSVAVRSSATAEDLAEASFAGQQETFLNVRGEAALLQAVRGCLASLFSERAVAYRKAQGVPEESVRMAVVVQQMVAANAAGVLFTRDPTAPESGRMLVEGAWGLGELVVSGRVTPDRWTLDRETGAVLTAALSAKPVRLTARGEETVPGDLAGAPCLSPEQLSCLAELGRRVEALYGAPQDVEWAFVGGDVFLLQSRPITAHADEREAVRRKEIEWLRARAEPDGTVWARYSLSEVLPEPLPFTWALWSEFMSGQGGYGRMYRELGFDPDPCLDHDGVVDLVLGRPYFNLSRDTKLYFRNFPNDYPFAKLKANPELAIYPRAEPNLAKAPKGFLLKMIGVTRQMMAAEKTLDRATEEVPALLEEQVFPRMAEYALRARGSDLSKLSPADLLKAVGECRSELFDGFLPQALKPSVLAGLAIQKLQALLKPTLGEAEARAAVDRILGGVAPPPNSDLAGALRALAEGTLARESFLEAFGHRGPGEMELANPRWREAPALLPSVDPAGPAFGVRDQTTRPPDHQTTSHAPPRVDARQYALQSERARRFTALRESAKHYLMLGYDVLRRPLLELDRRFSLEGGVFYLNPDELRLLLTGEELRGRVAERRRQRALALGLEAPRVLFSDDLEALGRPLPEPESGEIFEGTGVSPGTAEGEALVLLTPQGAPPEARDFILVCPSTDPGWVPLFLRARGVVLETGGVLSHGAIVAREFGLPAVANIAGACSRFRDGQRLRVDGGAGRVWVMD